MHMKKNIPFAMLLRAIPYCSSFQLYVNERESLKIALLLNKYPNKLIQEQFLRVFKKFDLHEQLSTHTYDQCRSKILTNPYQEKLSIDYETNIFIHFTYCLNMRRFPVHFHALWKKYFAHSPINDINPILGTRNVDNFAKQLIYNKNRKTIIPMMSP